MIARGEEYKEQLRNDIDEGLEQDSFQYPVINREYHRRVCAYSEREGPQGQLRKGRKAWLYLQSSIFQSMSIQMGFFDEAYGEFNHIITSRAAIRVSVR